MRSPPRPLEGAEEEGRIGIEEHDEGYDTCEACESKHFTASLVNEAMQKSLMVQDVEVSMLLQALCEQLKVQEKQKQKLKNRWDSAKQKLRTVRLQLHKQHNLQGQSSRYWWMVQGLRGQLGRMRTRLQYQAYQQEMQWHGGYQQTHFPP